LKFFYTVSKCSAWCRLYVRVWRVTALEWLPGDNNCWTNEETIITPVYPDKKPVEELRPPLQQQPPNWSPQPTEENTTNSNSQHQDISGKRQWSCELCGSQFTLQSSYSRHIKYMHSSHRSYICLLCGANFKRKDNLASHLKHRHMDKTP
jgi:DNA-directed RNA polymerase subunit RPC12/RpoP